MLSEDEGKCGNGRRYDDEDKKTIMVMKVKNYDENEGTDGNDVTDNAGIYEEIDDY